MKTTLVGILIPLLGALILINAFAFVLQPGMVFFPRTTLDATPKDWGFTYRDVRLRTRDGVELHGWFIPHPQGRRVLLFFHGNAGNISHRGESLLIFHRLGLSVLIFDYRGYGRSAGRPGERGLYLDAQAAWDHLTGDLGYAPADIVLFGRSLGGVVAARLASELGGAEAPGALILEATLSSARDVGRTMFPVIGEILVLRYKLDAERYVRTVECPVLVLHSPDDEIIPYRLGRKLYQAAPHPKEFVDLRGDHNMGFLLSQPGYERAIGDFLSRHLDNTER